LFGVELSGGSAPTGPEGQQMVVRRRVLWDRLMTARGCSGRSAVTPQFPLAAVQDGLAPDEVVISYYWLSRATLLITTFDRERLVTEKFDLSDREWDDLASLAADQSVQTEQFVLWLDDEVPRLGRLLLPQQGCDVLAGKKRVVLSLHRVLHQLPFHAFEWEGGLLVERFAVSYIPNLTSLLLPAPPPRPPQVFTLGISEFNDPPLASLPNATPAARDVAALYEQVGTPILALLGEQATHERIEDLRRNGMLSRFTMLHLVTHGQDIPPDQPFDANDLTVEQLGELAERVTVRTA
jgi:hypothetical protein